MNAYHEHEFEAAPGLPEALPSGEHILWQGAPSAWLMAVHAFHVRKLAIYFALMLLLQALYLSGEPGPGIGPSLALSAVLAGGCLLLLLAVAWYCAHHTRYTLTNRRVVMRIGMVLTITLNIPLRQIQAASVRPLPGGAGELALALRGSQRLGWLHLWPHVKAWTFRQPEPALRGLPAIESVSRLLMQAWRAENPQAPWQSAPTESAASGQRPSTVSAA